jgi:hypothetical protein
LDENSYHAALIAMEDRITIFFDIQGIKLIQGAEIFEMACPIRTQKMELVRQKSFSLGESNSALLRKRQALNPKLLKS